jgi:hypothetical protein
MILHPKTGPSACIFNSFYGAVSEDDAHKYSGEFIEQQFYEIFQNGTDRLGEIATLSKYHFIDDAKTELLYRWCYYTVNLLGDPETSLFEVRNEIPIIDQVYVDDDFDENIPGWGVTHFNIIQEAINEVGNSGTVNVYNGSYCENLEITKPISLIGENKDSTEIIGNSNGDVIKIYDEVKISGFSIKNSGNSQNDAGIKIYTQMNIINNNTISGNNIGINTEEIGDNRPYRNRIYNNNILNNNQNAFDNHDNMFYGNYWDDYIGIDKEDDGVGDDPYNFSFGKDYCPFMEESNWDNGLNHLPILPIIIGPSTGKTNTPYSFNFETADPNADNVYIYVDMGDGAYSNWEGPFASHDIKNLLYYYEQAGVYTIKARARDEHGVETDLIKFIVIITKDRAINIPFYQIFKIMITFFKTLRNLRLNLLY